MLIALLPRRSHDPCPCRSVACVAWMVAALVGCGGPTRSESSAEDTSSTGDAAQAQTKPRGSATKRSKPGRGRKSSGRGASRDRDQAAVAVEQQPPQPATIRRFYELSGTLTARRAAQLRPVQPGIVQALLAEEGDVVEKGQLLARLDGRERALMAARDELNQKNAQRELQRLEAIASSQALSREEVDKQRFALESATASSKLSRYQAKLNLIRAPFAGIVTARNVELGNLAAGGEVLFEIADVSALELQLHVPEREALRVAVGAVTEVSLLDETAFDATVVRRAPVVDPLTGTVKLTARAETFPAGAMPGAFVRAKILLESREVPRSVPKSAVFDLDGRPHVYAVIEGRAQRVPVSLGLTGEHRVELVDGPSADQPVVTDGVMDITDGMPLRPATAPAERPGAANDDSPAAPTAAKG
ncbi:MAG: efflux RND transporter periplasmic adaptor subunit [Myxococcales bacterium FL481]|nr:MAG: efflux RND transporter periplasmic adaptor subunit [Myxococcales bacterium FL481]